MAEKLIVLARDFSRHPGPRRIGQGPNSGEKFRKMLLKALSSNEKVIVDLDGTSGIGSSFLDEAFGGLVFAENIPPQELKKKLVVRSTLDSSYLITVTQSIELAAKQRSVS